MGTTNYSGTFIRVAEDCPVETAQQPPVKPGRPPSVAALQYALISAHPYELTSDDVLFEVHATRTGIPGAERDAARAAFFARSQACLRSSPLAKRYGWGIHHDDDGHVALVASGTPEYRTLSEDPAVRQLTALRSTRA